MGFFNKIYFHLKSFNIKQMVTYSVTVFNNEKTVTE